MKVVLRPEMQKYVREKVKAGHYADASELVNEALEVLRDQEQLSAKQAAYFRREVQRGLDQLDRRELSEFTAETIIAQERSHQEGNIDVPDSNLSSVVGLLPQHKSRVR